MKLASICIGIALFVAGQVAPRFEMSTLPYQDPDLHFIYHYPWEFGSPVAGQNSLDNIKRTTPDQGLKKTVS
jgi:hypothetical protein